MPKTLGGQGAMSRKARDEIVGGLTILVLQLAIAVFVGWLIHQPGMPTIAAGFVGAFVAVVLLVLYGALYRWWARVFWGAPFALGDRLRVACGQHAGKEGRVTALGQGATVDVELMLDGVSSTVELPWGSVRRTVAAQQGAAADDRPHVGVAARVAHGAAGDFYVADRQCLLCMNPLHAAPELMGYFDAPEGPAGSTCFFARQPSTAVEVDTAIRAIENACCGALRYGGKDPTILGKLAALGLADRCDASDKGHRGGA